ncbi:hypothetical protein DICA3_F29338 [Diutina catenulata]
MTPSVLRVTRRYASRAPRKSYYSDVTPPQRWWNQVVPYQAKYFAGLGGVAVSFVNIHHDILITGVPPLAIAGYFGYKWWHRSVAAANVQVVTPECDLVRVEAYDESSLNNALAGLDSEFDHFRAQVVQLVTSRIKEEVAANPEGKLAPYFLQDSQFSVHFGDIDTFVVAHVPVPDQEYQTIEFVKFSMPFYPSKSKKKREGVIEVYLLETERNDDYTEFRIAVDVRPEAWFNPEHIWLGPGESPQLSDLLKKAEQKK